LPTSQFFRCRCRNRRPDYDYDNDNDNDNSYDDRCAACQSGDHDLPG